MKPRYSIIVPVFNRPVEVLDLVDSLLKQTVKNFELIVVEDGSTMPCKQEVEHGIAQGLNAHYFFKDNEGRSIARNYGMERATGDWFVFFDSDCVIPSDYFEKLENEQKRLPLDCFGGPDSAHDSFSNTQKAISYTMTSFLTTGGIRGGKVSMEKFTPRTFNMGFSRDVWQTIGGFREMFSEDIDMSTRIRQAGYSIGLYPELYVWHKRRIDFTKFLRQVYVFGMSRITLQLLYPGSLKLVHALPALFVLGLLFLIVLAICYSLLALVPIGVYLLALFIGALTSTHSLSISLLVLPAALVQLCGYGCGFLKAFFVKILLRKGRNEQEEILIRKGK